MCSLFSIPSRSSVQKIREERLYEEKCHGKSGWCGRIFVSALSPLLLCVACGVFASRCHHFGCVPALCGAPETHTRWYAARERHLRKQELRSAAERKRECCTSGGAGIHQPRRHVALNCRGSVARGDSACPAHRRYTAVRYFSGVSFGGYCSRLICRTATHDFGRHASS